MNVYRRNVGPHAWEADLKDIFRIGPMLSQLAPDIVCGGPPCQDYWPAGESVEGENAALTEAFAMLVFTTVGPLRTGAPVSQRQIPRQSA